MVDVSLDQPNLAICSLHTCPVVMDMCVTDIDFQTTAHGRGGRDQTTNKVMSLSPPTAMVVQRGCSGCTSCSLLWRASAVIAASYHRLAITPFTLSNDVIPVAYLHCLSQGAPLPNVPSFTPVHHQ